MGFRRPHLERRATSLGKFAPPDGGSATYRYSVVLEPHNRSWLFALERPTSLPEDSRYTADGICSRPAHPHPHPLRISSGHRAARCARRAPAQLARALRLPAGVNPRSSRSPRTAAASRDDDEIVARAIGFLRQGRYA